MQDISLSSSFFPKFLESHLQSLLVLWQQMAVVLLDKAMLEQRNQREAFLKDEMDGIEIKKLRASVAGTPPLSSWKRLGKE